MHFEKAFSVAAEGDLVAVTTGFLVAVTVALVVERQSLFAMSCFL